MIPMTVREVLSHFTRLDPDEKVLIGWWDKECLDPYLIRVDDAGHEIPLEDGEAAEVWREMMRSAEGRFERDSEYVYDTLVQLAGEEIDNLDEGDN